MSSLDALRKAYAVLDAILDQWEEKKLEPYFFTTPYEMHETLAEVRVAIEEEQQKQNS